MSQRTAAPGANASKLGPLLREWRRVRGKSQIDLSLDSGISQRHVSFIESGRSSPSRETLITLADSLNIPLRERNPLFLAAGYAPIYSEQAWDAGEMRSLTRAVQRLLQQHDPFPALVMDRYWNVLTTNQSAPRFFGSFIDLSKHKPPRNLLHLLFDPDGMRPFVKDWESMARALIQRVYRESVGQVVDPKTQELLQSLARYPGVKAEWRGPRVSDTTAAVRPVIAYSFLSQDRVLNYFSMVTTVGSPAVVAAQELRIESMFPNDPQTEAQHGVLMQTGR
jgi:transcriptional regulator with XRE-family HTH domain